VRLDGSTVLVTGGTGFVGRPVVDELQGRGSTVVAVGRDDCDLRRRDEVHRLLTDTAPDAVIHLAAVVGGIGANQAEPGRFFYENAVMGIELLEACRVHGVDKVVVAGTVCAYPNHTETPFREDDLWDGYPEETNAPYGLAKRMLLVQGTAYRQQYGSNIVHLLPANLYGPGDNFDLRSGHVIPSLIRRFVEARDTATDQVTLWGDGTPTREFLYVDDAARGFRLALEAYDDADPVNLGSGEEVSIAELANLIAELTGFAGRIAWDTSKPNGQPLRRLETSRALECFGFEPTVSLREGLQATIASYREALDASVTTS